jgi:hypothetical protein
MQEEYSYAVRNRKIPELVREATVANGIKGECFMSAITGRIQRL